MESLTKRIGLLLLALGLAVAPACGDSDSDGEQQPPDFGDGDGDNGDGDNGDGDNGDGDGPKEPSCFENPKTSSEILNQCLPAGSKIQSRKFENEKRLPEYTGTLPPIVR